MNVEQVGSPARHRVPTRFRPEDQYFWAGMLCIFAFGMAVVGTYEAYLVNDAGWCGFFAAMAVGSAGLYFWMVNSWLFWVSSSGD